MFLYHVHIFSCRFFSKVNDVNREETISLLLSLPDETNKKLSETIIHDYSNPPHKR